MTTRTQMIRLVKTINARGTPGFVDVLKQELEQLDPEQLPLQQGLSAGSHVQGDGFSVMILGVSEENDFIRARAGIFYTSIIAGCSCADDPTPISELNEHCEVRIDINKETAEMTVVLQQDHGEKT